MDVREKREAAKAYLQQLRHMSRRIEELEENIAELRDGLIYPQHTNRERVKESKRLDSFERKMAASIDVQLKHDELVFQYIIQRDKIVMEILELQEPMHSILLYETFCNFADMKTAAKAAGITRVYASHEITMALVEFFDRWLAPGPHDPPGALVFLEQLSEAQRAEIKKKALQEGQNRQSGPRK